MMTMLSTRDNAPRRASKENTNTGVGGVIRAIRKARGMTQAELAHRANMKPSSLCRLELGEYPYTEENLKNLSAVLNTPLSTIFAQAEAHMTDSAIFYGCVVGQVPIVSLSQILEYADTGEWGDITMNNTVSVTRPVKAGSYAFEMLDDSMSPVIPEGAHVVIEPHEHVAPRTYVAVMIDGAHPSLAIAQYVIVNGREMFRPANDRYLPFERKEGDRILGVIRQAVSLLPVPH